MKQELQKYQLHRKCLYGVKMEIFRKLFLLSVIFCIVFFFVSILYNSNLLAYNFYDSNYQDKVGEDKDKINVKDKNNMNMMKRSTSANNRSMSDNIETLLFPSLEQHNDDRIFAQMKHKPKNTVENEKKNEHVRLKTILLYDGVKSKDKGQQQFIRLNCPFKHCQLTGNRSKLSDADAVVFRMIIPSLNKLKVNRPQNQVWVFHTKESPYHSPKLSAFNDVFNWTATYRHDSVIVFPYYNKFIPFNDSVVQKPQSKNYALNKTKKIAWFVSNCQERNGRRTYAKELSKYMKVDVYGSCGSLMCPKSNSTKCLNMLDTDYKFYLAFENSNCREYITEKFFKTALMHDVIPIAMGAPQEDYKRVAPPHSFIHVDEFESPQALAGYLHKLDKNDDLYNEYFRWKSAGSFMDTQSWCRLCAMMHEIPNHPPFFYHNLDRWWRGPGVCIGKGSWRSRSINISKPIMDNY